MLRQVTVGGSRFAVVEPQARRSEEAFVASVSSCHMLTFLYVAAKAGFAVTH